VAEIRNAHQASIVTTLGERSRDYQTVARIRRDAGLSESPAAIANVLWRLGNYHGSGETSRTPLGSFDDLRREYGLIPPLPDPKPITLGRWRENAWYPDFSYAKWMYPFFTKERRKRIFEWNLSRGLPDIVSCASEADAWSNSTVTPRRFRWWESQDNTDFMLASIKETREAGLCPLLTVFEHTSIPLGDAMSIARAQRLADLTAKDVRLYILSWEIDERIPNSRERWRWEKMMCREVDWHGRDLGFHYARSLEGSGNHVYGGNPNASDPADRVGLRQAFEQGGNAHHRANVVRLYQANRNISLAQLGDEAEKVGRVARDTGTKCAAFEHSGTDPAIGDTRSEAECNQRATIAHNAMRRYVDESRTGSMNGVV